MLAILDLSFYPLLLSSLVRCCLTANRMYTLWAMIIHTQEHVQVLSEPLSVYSFLSPKFYSLIVSLDRNLA